MRKYIRAYLLNNTPRTHFPIEDGVVGEFSKITEEYLELEDALESNNRPLSYIESLDLIEATFKFQFKHFKSIIPVAILFILLRRLYKPIRNRIYDYAGLSKEDFNG